MLKHSITYTDFDDNTVTDILYFNISKSELVEMQIDGIADLLQKLTKPDASGKEQIETFKKIIGQAYGERSGDGKRFKKSKELTDEFLSSPAYDQLFMDLIKGTTTDMATFIAGMMPKDLDIDGALAAAGGTGVKVNLPDTTPPALPITSVITPPAPVAPSPAADPAVPNAFAARRRGGHGPQQRAPEQEQDAVPEVVKPLDQMSEAELTAELARRQAAKQSSASPAS